MPAFLLLVLFEKWYGWRKGNDTVRSMDMISSLSSGVTNVTKDVLGLSIAIISYNWLVKHVALTHIGTYWYTYVIVFIVLDFSGYLVHRLQHSINFFWNAHIIHHSSEEFNLACALRQSVSVFVQLFAILLLPAALLGIEPIVIATVAPLHLFAQFWYHTRHIGKMGFLEKILVTPSHHRVHHAINPEYMDKNFSQIFIVWDKWLGSFQEEMDKVPPVYGVTRPVQTWNPIKINFQHLWLLIKDAWRTKNFKDKLRIWFMPTGWRPADVAEKYPVHKIEDVYDFEKYDTPYSKIFLGWVWVQMIMLLIFISFLFGTIAQFTVPNMLWYGAFVFMFVYALTELMDGSRIAWLWESFKFIMGISFILSSGDWFGLNAYWVPGTYIFLIYFFVSLLVTLYIFYKREGDLIPKLPEY